MVARLDEMIEANCFALDEDEGDLCMRDAVGLDKVFHGLITVISGLWKRDLPLVKRQEVVQVAVITKSGAVHDARALYEGRAQGCKGAPVLRRRPKAGQGFAVKSSSIPFVTCKSILGIGLVEGDH